jgi:hypothetical protein
MSVKKAQNMKEPAHAELVFTSRILSRRTNL